MRRTLGTLIPLLMKERYWSILFLVYLLAWIVPFHWMKDLWLEPFSTLAAQPFVLLGFLLVLWGRREHLAAAWQKIQYDARHLRRLRTEGDLTLLIVGCILYFFAHFSRLALVGILGLVLMLVGMVVRTYGKLILQVLLAPFFYLLAIVPWLPESGTAQVGLLGLRVYSIVLSPLLRPLGKVVVATQESISVNGSTIITHPALYGTQGIFAAVVFFWGYGLYRGYPSRKIVSDISLGCLAAALVHLLRFVVVCFFIGSSPVQAVTIASLNSWIFTLPSILLTFLLVRLLPRLKVPTWMPQVSQTAHKTGSAFQRPVEKVLDGSVTVGGILVKGIVIVFSPLTWIASQLWRGAEIGIGWLGQVNKILDSRLRKADRAREQRRMKK